MISESWVQSLTMLELRRHIKNLTVYVSGKYWCLAKYELVAAQAARDLAVVVFEGDVVMILNGAKLSLDKIDDLIDSQAKIIAAMGKI